MRLHRELPAATRPDVPTPTPRSSLLEPTQPANGLCEAPVEAASPCREVRALVCFFAKNLLISAFIEPRKRRLSLLYLGCCPGVGSCTKNIGLRIISKPAATLPVRICVVQGEGEHEL